MFMKKVMSASDAIAHGARLCRPGVVPMYPITPQTLIVEKLSEFINNGELEAKMIHSESEHSALSSQMGAQATGIRTFTATASQGLAYMFEVLPIVSGNRLPCVISVVNRALSAPINIWNDQSDSVSCRDQGWLQLYVESSQEALDTVIQAFKISENKKVLLPTMVCLDGFTLSHVYEPVDIPDQGKVDKFLPKYNPEVKLDSDKPVTMGPIGFPDTFMEFKEMQQKAMEESLKVIVEVHEEFKKEFGRGYGNGLLEEYELKDAEYALIGMGTVCGTTKEVVDNLRKEGKKVGLIKLKSFRPFPRKELLKACNGLKGLGVIDRNISLGNNGALYDEMRSCLYDSDVKVSGFIAGLGGRDIDRVRLRKAFEDIMKGKEGSWLSGREEGKKEKY